jgi:integrase/recombinase XerD
MTALALEALPPHMQKLVREHAAALVSDPTKDQRYRAAQLGAAVADYLSWKENEDGARPTTLDSYERTLARLAITIDKPVEQLTIDDLRAVRDSYPRGSRRKVTAHLRDFAKWLYDEEHTRDNVAGRMRYPKREHTVIEGLFDDDEKRAIVAAQKDIMDRAGVLLLLRGGLRQGELREMRVRDVNLAERHVLVRRGKGGKHRTVPIKGELVRALDELFLTDVDGLNRPRRPDEYLLCPTVGGRSRRRDPSRPMSKRGAHEWWYRCLHRAGIVEEGVTSGRRMHLSRHTYATDLGRATGWAVAAVSKNLGHQSGKTTMDLYWHLMIEDQADAVAMLPEIGE